MTTYNSFEDLPVWINSTKLATSVCRITSQEPLSKAYGLKDQLQRSAISVPSNIAEGFERGSKQELIHFLYIARGSCGELRTQLYIANGAEFIKTKEFNELYYKAIQLSKQINGFIEYLKSSNAVGQKLFKKNL